MRLLGNCPKCGSEDTIVETKGDEFGPYEKYGIVKCESCETLWNDWFDLRRKEREKGNILTPVKVRRMRGLDGREYSIEVLFQRRDDIPYANLIASVLNSALLTRFNKLSVNFSTEGGVEGFYKRTYIELRNSYDRLGLFVEQDYWQGPGLIEVIDFYEKMLRLLFEEPLKVGKIQYRRAEILRLPKDDIGYTGVNQAWKILDATLTKTRSKAFAYKAIRKLIDEASNPFSGSYLRGLTTEEIVQRFVPP